MEVQKKHVCSCCFGWRAIVFLIISGIAMIAFGVAFTPVVDKIFRDKIDENVVLGPGLPTYKPWLKSTVPIHSKYYLFDILNPEEVKQGMKPFVKERGPYVYRAYTEKINITWDSKNATVTYNERTMYSNDSDVHSYSSCNPFVDEVTTVNVPLIVIAEILKSYPDYLDWKRAVSALLEIYSEGLFITRKVHELLWGYEDPLLVAFAELREKIPFLKSLIPKVNTVVFLQPNNTLQGRTTIHTGAKDVRNVQQWKNWNGKHVLDLWLTKYANALNGTDGRLFAPRLSKSDTIHFMSPQLCRSLYITFDKTVQFCQLETYRFTIPRELFQSGRINSNNAAFYPHGFLPTGILDPRECQVEMSGGNINAPVFISAPHFYLGDRKLVEAVDGVMPNKEKHEFLFDIEPHVGVPLQNAIRLQVVAFIEPIKDITETSGVRKVYMPIMWFDESAKVDTDTADQLRDEIILPMKICHYCAIAAICIGSVLLLLGLILMCRKRKMSTLCWCRSKEHAPLLQPPFDPVASVNFCTL